MGKRLAISLLVSATALGALAYSMVRRSAEVEQKRLAICARLERTRSDVDALLACDLTETQRAKLLEMSDQVRAMQEGACQIAPAQR